MPFTSIEDLLNKLSGQKLGYPALWECPIQEGVPTLLRIAEAFLVWIAAFAFLIGVLMAIYYFVTSFGNDDKIKKGKSTLTYVFVGAAVVLLSHFVIQGIANSLTKVKELDDVTRTQGCVQQQKGDHNLPELRGA